MLKTGTHLPRGPQGHEGGREPLPKAPLGSWKERAVPCPFRQLCFQYTVAPAQAGSPYLPTSPSQDKDAGLGRKSCHEGRDQERHVPGVPVAWGPGRDVHHGAGKPGAEASGVPRGRSPPAPRALLAFRASVTTLCGLEFFGGAWVA